MTQFTLISAQVSLNICSPENLELGHNELIDKEKTIIMLQKIPPQQRNNKAITNTKSHDD